MLSRGKASALPLSCRLRRQKRRKEVFGDTPHPERRAKPPRPPLSAHAYGHPQGMPLQWMTDHPGRRVRTIVGASLVGALGGEGDSPKGCRPYFFLCVDDSVRWGGSSSRVSQAFLTSDSLGGEQIPPCTKSPEIE